MPNPKSLITEQRMRTYRECPRKHHFIYALGVHPIRERFAIRFDRLWRALMRSFYGAALLQTKLISMNLGSGVVHVPNHLYDSSITAAMYCIGDAAMINPHGYLATANDGECLDPFMEARLYSSLELYVRSLRRAHFFEDYKIKAVGLQVRFNHINPDTQRSSPLWMRAVTIDVLATHKNGYDVVIEHKTTSDPIHNDSAYWGRLVLDNQIARYVIGAEVAQMFAAPVKKCIYDVLRTFGISPLKATPRDKWRYKIRTKKQIDAGLQEDDESLLYASIRMQDETPSQYGIRCNEKTVDRGSRWHSMFVVDRTKPMIKEHLRNAWVTGKMMRQDERMGWSMQNTDACHRRGTCPFWCVCTKQTSIEDPKRFKKHSPFYPSLEAKVTTSQVHSQKGS